MEVERLETHDDLCAKLWRKTQATRLHQCSFSKNNSPITAPDEKCTHPAFKMKESTKQTISQEENLEKH